MDRTANMDESTAPGPPRVLVVDGDPANREFLSLFLTDAGFDVGTAPDGLTALQRARDESPAVALVDVALVGTDGIALCQALQAVQRPGRGRSSDEFSGGVPIILMAYDRLRAAELLEIEDSGVVDFVVKPVDPVELRARVRAAVRAKQAHDTLLHQAATDGLTGMLNRHYLFLRAAEAIAFARRHGGDLACAMVDLDLFKQVNDRFGHEVGDTVLREVAARLRAAARASDVVARYGGDEFVLLLPQTGEAGAVAMGEKIRSVLAATPIWVTPAGAVPGAGRAGPARERRDRVRAQPAAGIAVTVRASLGVACWDATMATPEALFAAADAALYQAKETGRDRTVPASSTGWRDAAPAVRRRQQTA
jgi:diguanylate cyclase (GGDEF)-like protein